MQHKQNNQLTQNSNSISKIFDSKIMLNLHSVPSNYVTAKPTTIVNLKIGDRFAKQSEITTFTSSETQHQFHF